MFWIYWCAFGAIMGVLLTWNDARRAKESPQLPVILLSVMMGAVLGYVMFFVALLYIGDD